MAIFFDINSAADIDLLHPSVRTDAEVPNQADRIEFEIIEFYKQRDMQGLATYEDFFRYERGADPTRELKVRLAGFDQTDPAQSEAGLKEALRRTIADVLSYVLRNMDAQNNVSSQSQGNRSIAYTTAGTVTWREFPSGWNRLLRNYDARIQGYGI
jgi:hypothetical protein